MRSTCARALILASRSPRRATLLREAGYDIRIEPSHEPETWPSAAPPRDAVVMLAAQKAGRIAARYPEEVVLGADTEVCLDGRPLGKPTTSEAARRMLAQLSGRRHEVWTGVALVRGSRVECGAEMSRVNFRSLSTGMIDDYLARAQFADKAGGYGIQEEGGELIDSWSGRLDTIIGLPLNLVEALWRRIEEPAK